MIIFHIIFLWLGAGLLIKNRYQYPYLVISFIILFLISGFRTLSVGTDTYNYLKYFKCLADYGVDSKEIGWGIVNKVVIFFGGGFNYVLVLNSILVIIPILYVARSISAQSIAFDSFVGNNDEHLIVEMSYGFGIDKNEVDNRYWDEKLEWQKDRFGSRDWMIKNILNILNYGWCVKKYAD